MLTTAVVSFGSAYLGSAGYSQPVRIFGMAALQIGGVLAMNSGGNRGHAILAAAFSSVADFEIYTAGLQGTSQFIAQTLASGTAAEIGDGKFANGALTVMETWAIRGAAGALYGAMQAAAREPADGQRSFVFSNKRYVVAGDGQVLPDRFEGMTEDDLAKTMGELFEHVKTKTGVLGKIFRIKDVGDLSAGLADTTISIGLRDITLYRVVEGHNPSQWPSVIDWSRVEWKFYDEGGEPIDVMRNFYRRSMSKEEES